MQLISVDLWMQMKTPLSRSVLLLMWWRKFTVKETGFRITMGTGLDAMHIFKMVYLKRDTQLRCPEPGLGTEEKVSWAPVFLSFGFLTAEAMRPAPSRSCLQVFPAMMAWALSWWSKWNSSLYYFSGIASPQWEKWLILGNHPSSNSAH